MSKFRLVVLASGKGSNFAAIADAIQEKKIKDAEIVTLFCNVPNAPVIALANERKIPCTILNSRDYIKKNDRASYEKKLLETLLSFRPDLICLAGYMLLLSPETVRAFPGKIINIHPSLLPLFKGLNAQQQAVEAGAKETGCTVHFVNENLDDGQPILQKKIPINVGETVESLSKKLILIEHEVYVEAIQRCLSTFRKTLMTV